MWRLGCAQAQACSRVLARPGLRRPRTEHSQTVCRGLSTALAVEDPAPELYMGNVRNIGISAHIDSGKTTLTERILYYTGRINAIHDVRGKDGVGAKMDSMDLEREKGITIQSAATYCAWGDNHINIIDTPGHVDFTIEVERALRVLDGAILVLCGVSGVQSQSLTVDRQMKRYNIPRLAFINKLDRMGSNPTKITQQLRTQLGLNAAAVQLPIGLEDQHSGVVDLVRRVAYINKGARGEMVQEVPVPKDMLGAVEEARQKLVEMLADVDDEVAELFLAEEEVDVETLRAAIRRSTIALKFVPVFMGSAFKNKGVQPLLDGVVDYLPSPTEVPNVALDTSKDEAEVPVECRPDGPLLALAFKLEEGKYGQLTYMRVYSGLLKRGMYVHNLKTSKKVKVPRLVRMHSNEMEEVQEVGAGDVVAMFGAECSSMDTLTDGTTRLAMSSMYVPEPVMSLAVLPRKTDSSATANFMKAFSRFTREDPTLRVHTDNDTKQTIISGMGELHLEVYVERLRREYNVDCEVGQPRVNYRETIRKRANFNFLHKKQSGGSGQYARVVGYIEPLGDDYVNEKGEAVTFEFDNQIVGMAIPPDYIASVGKGAEEAVQKGVMIGHQVFGVRVVLQDGQTHVVDSSDMAFKFAGLYAVREAMKSANPSILEPIMTMEATAPAEFQGALVGSINKRSGSILDSQTSEDGVNVVIKSEVPLSAMFGYSTELRSQTQGRGEYSMEYKEHTDVPGHIAEQLAKEYRRKQLAGETEG